MAKAHMPSEGSAAETLPWIAVGVVALAALILIQQWGVWLSGSTISGAGQQRAWEERLTEPGLDELTITSKAIVRIFSMGGELEMEADEAEVLEGLDFIALTAADEIRVAVVAGELHGPEETLRRLTAIDERLGVRAELRGDVRWFRELYERAAGESAADGIGGAEVMRARHGWFTDLALSRHAGSASDQPSAEALTGGGLKLIAVLAGVGIAHGLVSLLALVVGIWALIKFFDRDGDAIEMSMDIEPAYLQAAVLFLIGAIVFSGLGAMASSSQGNAAVVFFAASEVAVWVAGLSVLWPRLRGVPGMAFRADTGWTLGEAGFAREVFWGFAGFCVSTGLTMLLSIGFGIVAMAAGSTEGGAETIDLPLFDSPIAPTWPLLLLGSLTAVLWAPFFEELVFRGCLFAWLRPRLGMWGTVAVTSIAFGAIHPYSIDGMLMVASGGVVYALLREWRGSLIAPITAHMLHNGLITVTELAVLAAID